MKTFYTLTLLNIFCMMASIFMVTNGHFVQVALVKDSCPVLVNGTLEEINTALDMLHQANSDKEARAIAFKDKE